MASGNGNFLTGKARRWGDQKAGKSCRKSKLYGTFAQAEFTRKDEFSN